MNNIQVEVKGNILTLRIDLSQPGEPSKSGKTNIIAGTAGFAPTGVSGVSMSVNICKKRD